MQIYLEFQIIINISMNAEKEMITMEKKGEWFDIKMGINSKVQRVTTEAVKAIKEGKPKIRNPNMFDSFYRRGKYRYIKYSYDKQKKQMFLHINREYYHRVLSNRTHDLAIFAKNISIVWDQYSGQVEYFLKNIIEAQRKNQRVQLINLDMLSITLSKDFNILNLNRKRLIRRYFLRQSNFQFRSNLASKPREEEYLFSIIYRDYEPDNVDQKWIPTDQDYYDAPRLNFIDDLHINESLIRRFLTRFLPFHQAFLLYDHKISVKSHRIIRQFYRKCVNQSYFYAMRLKKMNFCFTIKKMSKQIEKEKLLKFSIYFYYEDQPFKYLEGNVDSSNKNFFSIQSYYPEVSDRNLNEIFLKRIRGIRSEKEKEEDEIGFLDGIYEGTLSTLQKKIFICPKNEILIARILIQFSFFIDRIFFRLMESKEKRKIHSFQNQFECIMGNFNDDTTFRLPSSQEFTLSQSKYNHYYDIDIKSNFSRKSIEPYKKQAREFYNYETEINEIKMMRRKRAHSDDSAKDYELFQKHPSDFKGLKIYINHLLSAWNARDVYQDVIDFCSAYMNIVTQKLKDKVMLKNIGKWSAVIGGMEALIQMLTQSFNTLETTIKLFITQGFEDNKEGTEPGFTSDLLQNDCVMTMTFSLFKLTRMGWRPKIPTCAFYFKVTKSCINLINSYDERLTSFVIQMSKKKMQLLVKEQLRKIYDEKTIPKNYYEPE